jgi:suppressor for copper-sensitivity B
MSKRQTPIRLQICRVLGSLLWTTLPSWPIHATASDWIGDRSVAARLVAGTSSIGPGAIIEAGIQFRIAPGLHIYWRAPGESGLPPMVDWSGSVNIAGATIAWPFPSRLVVGQIRNNVYQGSVLLPVTVRLSHPAEATQLRAHLNYAACGEVCVPYDAELNLLLPAGEGHATPEAAIIADAETKVPKNLYEQGIDLDRLEVRRGSDKPFLAVVFRSATVPFVSPELFVDDDNFHDLPSSTAELSGGGHIASFQVNLPADNVDRKNVCLTLVDNGHAASLRATVPPRSQESRHQEKC